MKMAKRRGVRRERMEIGGVRLGMKSLRKWVGLCITIAMISFLLTGCGGVRGAEDKKRDGSPGAEDTEKSMGRYLESELPGPDLVIADYKPQFSLQWLEDGRLALVDRIVGVYASADEGESFTWEGCPWEGLTEEYYMDEAAISPQGEAAVICSPHGEEDAAEVIPEWAYYHIDGTGKATALSFPGGDGEFLTGLRFDGQGRLYGFATDSGVYRFDLGTGEAKRLFEVDGIVDFICFTDRYMVVVTSGNEILFYDLEEGMFAEQDGVLRDFLQAIPGAPEGTFLDGHSLVVAKGEQEDVIYLAFRGGLYRHVIGGTVMEQVIDGATSTFGDPSAVLLDMVRLPEDGFIAVFGGGKVCRYIYDPDVPTRPEHQIEVYSLTENYSLKQAASLFQKAHPDVYVRYEIGMNGEDGVTKEDAVRSLNTKILAGEGPDIMLLDGLPRSAYEEKGILADVSEIVAGLEGEEALFPNVVEACRKEGKLCALPIRIQVPMLVGGKEDIEKITDVISLADTVEEIREQSPEGAILGFQSPRELLSVLRLTSGGTWTDGEGEIDEEALAEFLGAAKRIWQAEMSGLEAGEEDTEMRYGGRSFGEDTRYLSASTRALNVFTGEQKLGVGKVYRVDFDYDVLTSLARSEEDFGYGLWNGQAENGFIPDGLAGLLANAVEDELAVEFYKSLFGRELQDMDLAGGLPVNMASFDSFAGYPNAPEDFSEEIVAGALGMHSDDGTEFFLELTWPSEEEFLELRETVSGLERMHGGDAAVEEVVLEVGEEMLKEDLTTEEAVREVVRRAAIYLAE